MTDIYINNNWAGHDEINGINSVSFNHIGEKVYSANKIDVLWGVFVSQVIVAPSNFVRWDELKITSSSLKNAWFYVRNASANIENQQWVGPYKNFTNEISQFNLSLLQIMVILKDNGTLNTKIDSLEITYISTEDSKLFFSKAFHIGFRAEHILLTYNADETEDSVIKFAISGEETTDISKYQYIAPNKVQELYSIPLYSDKIKLMMELAGDSGVPLKVHEISFVFSGEKYEKINFEEEMESSSSSLTSQSTSSVSESSSLSSSSSELSSSSSSNYEGIDFFEIEDDFVIY